MMSNPKSSPVLQVAKIGGLLLKNRVVMGNKDSVALHLKLNELLASHRGASNKLIGIEDASEKELRKIAAAYLKLASEDDGKHGKTSNAASPMYRTGLRARKASSGSSDD